MSRQTRPDLILQKWRREEQQRQVMVEKTKYYSKTSVLSEFDAHGIDLVKKRYVKQAVQSSRQVIEKALELRKAKLKELFLLDEQIYRQELEAQQISPLDKVKQMRARVDFLKEKREQERKAYVEEKLLEQFRKGADEIRTLESKLLEKKVVAQRQQQLIENQVKQENALKEKHYFEQLWEADRQLKIQREVQEAEHRRQLNQDMILGLEEQMALLTLKKTREQELVQHEAALLEHARHVKALEAEREHSRKLAQQAQIRLELDAFNKAKLLEKQKEVNASLEMDMSILKQVADQEAFEKASVQRKKKEYRQQVLEYRNYLNQQKLMEAEQQAELDKWYYNESERQWKARLDKWDREQKARDSLMQQVLATRQQQIQQSLEQTALAKQELEVERKKIEATIQEMKGEQAKAIQGKYEKQSEYSQLLKQQTADNARRRHLEQVEQERVLEAQRQVSLSYQKRLEAELLKLE